MKRKYWFEKIDATSTLPNFYPYSVDNEETTDCEPSAEINESVHSIFENGDNVLKLNSWVSDDQVAV